MEPPASAPVPPFAPAFLLLADGRFPIGGHAHSGGVEAAVADGRVGDEASLEAFVVGRLETVGLVEAALAAATVVRLTSAASTSTRSSLTAPGSRPTGGGGHLRGAGGRLGRRVSGEVAAAAAAAAAATLAELDAEADARVAPPSLRAASRRLGRQLVRVAARCWPHWVLDLVVDSVPSGLHQPVALGATGVAAGLSPADVAGLAVHHAVTTPAQAAVRLLGLDPFAVAAVTARLSGAARRVVAEALAAAAGPVAELPARAGPLLDLAAVEHDLRADRLFAT